jgi:tRNA 2-thiouridine synthesizing protein A
VSEPALTLDCRGMACPRPIIELARRMASVEIGGTIELLADDPAASADLVAWCRMRGQHLVEATPPRFVIARIS